MASDDEIVSRTADSAAPIPVSGGSNPRSEPTPDAVLKWIAAAGDQPWFPSQHAAATGIDRGELDGPLGQLRVADLVHVATWIRGVGQGYALTPEGVALVASGTAVPLTPIEPAPVTDDAAPRPTPEEIAARRFGLNLRKPVFVPVMLVANVCWFVVGAVAAVNGNASLGRYLADGQPQFVLHQLGAVMGPDLLNREWWRLLSACFVHIGLLHLFANMFALGMMGPLAELLWGRWRLTTIYVMSGLAGSCLAMAIQPDSLLAGASGAIWGILASLLAWLMLFRSELPPDVAAEWARRLWLAFLLNAGVSFLPGVSWEAHLGGGVAGFVTSCLLNVLRYAARPRQFLALVALAAIPVVCVGGLMASMVKSESWERYAKELRRQIDQDRLAPAIAADAALKQEIFPRLERLAPDTNRELQVQLWALLRKPKIERNPELLADATAKLTQLRTTANEVVTHLSTPPLTEWQPRDNVREKLWQFAELRSLEYGMLLDMLEAPTIPTDAAWDNVGRVRRNADAVLRSISPK